ncbi:PAS domain S-box-containing protein [Desulfonatronum zhilinae]|nr:PAS domain S-box-containing protein [Desulfonatronum zhilinae]
MKHNNDNVPGFETLGPDGQGKPGETPFNTRDFTSRKEAGIALEESEQRYRSYINNMPYGMFVADEQGRFQFVNPSACELSGYEEHELLGMKILELVSRQSRRAGVRLFRQVMEHGKGPEGAT